MVKMVVILELLLERLEVYGIVRETELKSRE